MKRFLLILLLPLLLVSCKKEDDTSSATPQITGYTLTYSFVGNDTLAHFFKGQVSYLDPNDNLFHTESFDILPWSKTIPTSNAVGAIKTTFAYKNPSDTLNYNAWVVSDTLPSTQITKTLHLAASAHIVCHANYSDGSRRIYRRRDQSTSSDSWQLSGPGTNTSFAYILSDLNSRDTINL